MKKLEITDLCKNYGKKNVLKNLNIIIDDKQIVALVGINGSGKTTLIEIICGIKKCNEGTILLDEKDITDKKIIKHTKEKIGYMPQQFSLFNDLTVRENLKYLAAIYEIDNPNRIDEVINDCFLKEKENYLAKNLSGGFKQLLSLASAIIHKPSFLILDEPTSAMDPLFRKQFWGIICDYNKSGTTVLVTTHYLEEIFKCHKLLCLSNGKIVHETYVDKLFENGKFKTVDEVLNYYILKEKDEK